MAVFAEGQFSHRALRGRGMLGAVTLDFLPGMDETSPSRGVPPVKTTGPSLSATSSFDLVVRANEGDREALVIVSLKRTTRGRRNAAVGPALQPRQISGRGSRPGHADSCR